MFSFFNVHSQFGRSFLGLCVGMGTRSTCTTCWSAPTAPTLPSQTLGADHLSGKAAMPLLTQHIRVVCPNFEHPALTSLFTKYKFLQMKNSLATFVNELSVLKLFQLSL